MGCALGVHWEVTFLVAAVAHWICCLSMQTEADVDGARDKQFLVPSFYWYRDVLKVIFELNTVCTDQYSSWWRHISCLTDYEASTTWLWRNSYINNRFKNKKQLPPRQQSGTQPSPNSAPSSLSLLSVEMDQNASEYVWTDVKCTISVFLKAINNFQSTFITYMVIKAMAPESPAFRESCVRNHSWDMTTILKQDPPPSPSSPHLPCSVLVCANRRVSRLHKLALPLWAPSPISLTFRQQRSHLKV